MNRTILLVGLLAAPSAPAGEPRLAWFTDAEVAGASRAAAPAGGLPAAPGTCGAGVRLDRAVPMAWPELRREEGCLGFWLRPAWNGDDGRPHRLLRIGDPAANGLLLEKSARGMLRFVMASPGGIAVARVDVSGWRAGEWHHVVLAWFANRGVPAGLPLWVDRVARDGPVAGRCSFLDPAALEDRRLWLGDPTAGADLDELICRDRLDGEGDWGLMATVHRDWFRTAPFDAVRVDPEPLRVPADRRVVAGGAKQLGLEAARAGSWEPVTDYAARYCQWGAFDAKPFIRWTTSDPAVAEVDGEGRVAGRAPGSCEIAAAFRGLAAVYPLEVIPPDRPDLGLICLEILPRYRCDAVRDRLGPGEAATARIRLGSFGGAAVPAGAEVRLDLVPVAAADGYRFDPELAPLATFAARIDRPLAPGEETAVEHRLAWPAAPVWLRVRLDPEERIEELCEANNESAERSDARPIQLGYDPKVLRECLAGGRMNHVGSWSYYDWLRAQKLRMDVMLREAVWPTTGPRGVEEAYRIDAMTALAGKPDEEEPYHQLLDLFDGGFPVNEPVDLMAVDAAILHEFGHTILSQPDLYGYGVRAQNVLLLDPGGRPYAGSPLLPAVEGDETMPFSPGINVACGGAYVSLMDTCQLWLHPAQAGHIKHYRGYRADRFWGTQGRLIPTRANWLLVTDRDDEPLRGVAVYVYEVVQAPVQDAGAKFFPDRPKFTGTTDDEGRFVFPGETDPGWDDPETDEVEGSIHVWNPFGKARSATGTTPDTAFTPNVWCVEGLLLLKIVAGEQVEFRWMDLLEFNEAFLAGNQVRGIYRVRTSLAAPAAPTSAVATVVPEAIRKVNLRPVATAPAHLTVKCGQEFEIDGSGSRDPEGQPLFYRWSERGPWPATDLRQGPVLRLRAPDRPGRHEYRFWVLDGLRCSEAATIEVEFVG